MKPEHLPFYLEGRDSKTLKHDGDDLLDEIHKRIDSGTSLRDAIWDVVTDAAQSFKSDRSKRSKFVRDMEDEIKESGGDETGAWEAFVQGKIDELAFALDPAVVEDLEGEDDEDEDGDEDADEDAEDDKAGEGD